MKGFAKFGKGTMRSGHHFGTKDGFQDSSGRVKSVSGYTRTVHKADGGAVHGPGHGAVEREVPTTETDAETGGRGPLRPGYKRGGPLKKAKGGYVDCGPMSAPKAAPKGNVGKGFNRTPMIGK